MKTRNTILLIIAAVLIVLLTLATLGLDPILALIAIVGAPVAYQALRTVEHIEQHEAELDAYLDTRRAQREHAQVERRVKVAKVRR